MAKVLSGVSRTFGEFLLLPNLTTREHIPKSVSLSTPLTRFRPQIGASPLQLKLPLVSAVMQAVSDHNLAVALAKNGGLSFIFHSQPIDRQVEMVRRVKEFRAGFSLSDSNLRPESTISDARDLSRRTQHHNIAVTHDGGPKGRLLGLLTRRDLPFDMDACAGEHVAAYMTPVSSLTVGNVSTSLDVAREIIWKEKIDCLPIVDSNGHLASLVFRKDFVSLKESPNEVLDEDRRLLVGAGINTHDYRERLPALVSAGANAFVVDSSDGFSEWQKDVLAFARDEFGEGLVVGVGNVVDAEGFRYLVESGASFVKVGIGGGSICITREQKGIGRGSADALMEVAEERDRYYRDTGVYIPICMDGGVLLDYQVLIALAMGADFVMMGRYFARFEESPGRKVRLGNRLMKEYWAEGSHRAANWARYDLGDGNRLKFEEGVNGLVPFVGDLHSSVEVTRAKLASTMCNCGALDLSTFRNNARLVVLSELSFRDNSAQVEQLGSDDAAVD